MTNRRLVRLGLICLLLLALPAILPSAQAAQRQIPCFAYDLCEACTATTARHCVIVQCNGHTTKNCGSCVTDCVAGL